MIPPETMTEFPFLKAELSKLVYRSPERIPKTRLFAPATYLVSRKELAEFQLKRNLDTGASLILEKVEIMKAYDDKIDLVTVNGSYQCDFVIGADRVNSVVRKTFIGKIPKENLGITFGYLIKDVQVENNYIKFQDSDGYIWFFNGDSYINAGIGKSISSQNNQNLRKQLDQYLESEFPDLNIISKWSGVLPRVRNLIFLKLPTCGNNWILVGDTAKHVNPILGAGIYCL